MARRKLRLMKPLRSFWVILFLIFERTDQVIIITKRGRKLTIWGTPKLRRWIIKYLPRSR